MAETNAENDFDVLHQRVTEFCDRAGYRISPQAKDILKDIVLMKEELGDFFCPCQTQKIPENVCICQTVRQGLVDLMGACFCGLILSQG